MGDMDWDDDRDDLAVLDDDVEFDGVAVAFTPAQRAALKAELIADHRLPPSLADQLVDALLIEPAQAPWPNADSVVQLSEAIASRLVLDRSLSLCVAVALTRLLGRTGHSCKFA